MPCNLPIPRHEPTIPWKGCPCSNPPFELCLDGRQCELDACGWEDVGRLYYEPIEDET
jgi:hypothetical protein